MRKSSPLSFRCIAVRWCHFHLFSNATELTQIDCVDYHLSAFWLLGWNALSSNSRPKSNVTYYSPSPLPRDYSIELLMQLQTVHWLLKHWFFGTAALFCVFTLFFAQPITFLHFYQRTSISEIWLHLLLLPQQHCVSSLNQRALTAAARGGEVTDNTLQHDTHLSPSKLYVTVPEWFTEYSTHCIKREPREFPLGRLQYMYRVN